ncbi:YbbR-like domain-containing protein [Dysgonomonas sp. 511]|uniref:CdaR family protein n=1 Tax=Dysgonomonas sp. 511 TaxID=2302930 RepID=UPI0013D8281A|nr:YbbR-like domain-containing protein [Dysgonomonas sp. 511]NDV78511.1 YbbR-like domain-containing protein [Dysgonomonas sp. 511]
MSDTKDIIIQKVRSSFRNISWKKTLTFLFFLLLSSIFWLMQVYREKFESTINIPIKYVNVPDSIIFDNELVDKITVRIKDDGVTMFRYYFTKRNDSLVIDIRKLIHEQEDPVILSKSMEQLIRNQLFSSSELISYSPSRLAYDYVILREKRLPVIYDGYISLATGYIIDGDLTVNPDSVTVYGSRTALDTIRYVHTVDDTIKEVTSSTKIEVPIKPIKGVKFVPDMVNISVPVDQFNTKEIEVPITIVNLPDNLNIRFFPSSVTIPIIVGLSRYNDITANNFEVKVDYNDIKSLTEPLIPVRITESPDYIEAKVPVPAEVEFVLERK